MKVSLLYFGALKDIIGTDREQLTLPPSSTLATLLSSLRTRIDAPGGLWNSLAVAVNREYAGASTMLEDGDEVALLPPVSGGSGSPGKRRNP